MMASSPVESGWNMNLAEKIVCALSAEGESLPTLAEVERVLVTVAIARYGMAGAWRVLGIGKTTLYRKALEYRIPKSGPWAPPRSFERWIRSESLEGLLLIGRESADYLLRCVGRAKQLGAGLDRELKQFEAPPEKNRALGCSTWQTGGK
jgi:hypothetical protein